MEFHNVNNNYSLHLSLDTDGNNIVYVTSIVYVTRLQSMQLPATIFPMLRLCGMSGHVTGLHVGTDGRTVAILEL